MKKILIASVLISVALLERIFFDLGPNVELVTLVIVLASMYLGVRYSVFVALAVTVLSDIVIGNTDILLFTWSGFLLPAIVLPRLIKRNSAFSNILNGTAAGAGSNLFFFAWTNFGVWLLSSMYPNTAQGLLMSYINGIPFLKPQLLGTLLFIPLGITIFEFARFFVAQRAKALLARRSDGLLPEKA